MKIDYDINFWSSRPNDEEFWSPYQQRNDSHKTSRDLVDILRALNLPTNTTCHEMGANMGRNLEYIREASPLWRLSANDVNPHAPDKLRRTYPDLHPSYTIESSQAWIQRTEPVDVVLSVSHFIHIEDLSPFVEWLPRKVKKYLLLREGAGLHESGGDYWNHWTVERERKGLSRWFDHDCETVFKGTSLALVNRVEQWSFPDTVNGKHYKRQYDIYVFEQTGEVDGCE